ncbi:zf-HC2 domain-containing protein [Candidatus Aerophobetes bacterium]|nr:zf-HC2 domain-containing protein [Candidatus Aerophobetes bacterium]
MKHEEYKKLLVGYLDGELKNKERELIENHLRKCPECQKELKEFKKLRGVMMSMKYQKPPDEVWENYWKSIYNRLERRISWILTSVGAAILLFYGGFKLVEDFIKNPEIALLLKIGILVLLAGLVILFISILRERIFIFKHDKYREVKR